MVYHTFQKGISSETAMSDDITTGIGPFLGNIQVVQNPQLFYQMVRIMSSESTLINIKSPLLY
jgi:hypothetical protein